MVVNKVNGFRSTAAAGAVRVQACARLGAGRLCGSLPFWCRMRA